MTEIDKILLNFLVRNRTIHQEMYTKLRAELAAELESNLEVSDDDAQELLECMDLGNAWALEELNKAIAELVLESA